MMEPSRSGSESSPRPDSAEDSEAVLPFWAGRARAGLALRASSALCGLGSGLGGSGRGGGLSLEGCLGGRPCPGVDGSRLGCLPLALGDGFGRFSSVLEPVLRLRLVPGREDADWETMVPVEASRPADFSFGSCFLEPCSRFRSLLGNADHVLLRLRFSSTCPGSFGAKKASSLLELSDCFMRSSMYRH